MRPARYPSEAKDGAPAPAKAGAGRFWRRQHGRAGGLERRGARGARASALAGLVGALAVVSAGAGVPDALPAYRDAPPPGYTGGFGEESCVSCHFQDSVNLPPGRLVASGAPERWTPGQVYPITVTLTRPGMQLGGFQLAVRFEEGGAQAGTLSAKPEDAARVRVTTHEGVEYAHHLREGSLLAGRDSAAWTVLWTAPSNGGGAVTFHVAANAASDDDSPLGDYIYTTEARSHPQ